MKKEKKKNVSTKSDRPHSTNGITLIALIITIIVMLILAGVSISVLFGNDGLITRASLAKEHWTAAEADESKVLNEYDLIVSNIDKLSSVVDGVPVPIGFTVSSVEGENEKDEGLVIKDSIGNEFVWVPVPNINDMYEVETLSGNNNKVGKLYDFSLGTGTPITYSTTGYREPDSTPADTSYADTLGISGVTTREDFENYLQEDFNKMIESVEKYGGFYIGRYETGDVLQETKVVSQKNKIELGGNTWHEMYRKQREMYLGSNSVVSGMIWGSQWDATMRWFQSFGGDTATYVTDSTGKANYTKNYLERITGSDSNYAVKNIYDMAGNVCERTIETTGVEWLRTFRRR